MATQTENEARHGQESAIKQCNGNKSKAGKGPIPRLAQHRAVTDASADSRTNLWPRHHKRKDGRALSSSTSKWMGEPVAQHHQASGGASHKWPDATKILRGRAGEPQMAQHHLDGRAHEWPSTIKTLRLAHRLDGQGQDLRVAQRHRACNNLINITPGHLAETLGGQAPDDGTLA